MLRRMIAVAGMVCVLSSATLAEIREVPLGEPSGDAAERQTYWSDAGYGTLCSFSNVFYMPAKVVYSGLGLLTGSLAYVLTVGNGDVAQSIWSPSLGGSYVITPPMLRGDEEIFFSGPSYSNE